MSVYVARYCVENIVDRDDLIEVLEDLMDEEFETACRDDSPKGELMLICIILDLSLIILLYPAQVLIGRHGGHWAIAKMPRNIILLSHNNNSGALFGLPKECHKAH